METRNAFLPRKSDALGRHVISVLVQNQPGVLSRVSGLFSRRGFNIDSLAVGPTEDIELSRITVTVHGDHALVDQMVQQLYKLICVQKVLVLDAGQAVERQLVLVKVRADMQSRDAVMRVVDIFRARIVDVTRETLTVEITGEDDKIAALLGLLTDYGIVEMVRTGAIALQRGPGDIKQSAQRL
ncbi:MAG: acetolactate synthase small subunit [Clostridia bacterium]|nr:acetolactate synthase small subunit [Clostridia bacterium]